ncbi:MAG: sugar phosphate isomerase/epimerase [Chthoniobacter sp.]|nr:sugar phosphate isomerase/epimerase [Chthoniobacter sp.]
MTILPTFLRTSLLVLATAALAHAGSFPDELKVGGFAVGCQAYTFNRFTVFEAIDKTASTGAKVIEFATGQKLSPEEPTVKFNHEAPPEVWAKVKTKLAEKGLTAVAYGVVALPKEEEVSRKVFEFAKYFGIRVINTESVDSIDTIEKLVKEYDIKVGFHDHPKRPDHPEYKMWDPEYVLSVVKDRDPRIGSCADIGHWVRSGLKPIDCVKILKGRIMSSHMKDLNAPLPSAHDVLWGTGVSDVPAILDEYKAQGFDGPISVEYEYNWENNVVDAAACIGFVRGYGAKK